MELYGHFTNENLQVLEKRKLWGRGTFGKKKEIPQVPEPDDKDCPSVWHHDKSEIVDRKDICLDDFFFFMR